MILGNGSNNLNAGANAYGKGIDLLGIIGSSGGLLNIGNANNTEGANFLDILAKLGITNNKAEDKKIDLGNILQSDNILPSQNLLKITNQEQAIPQDLLSNINNLLNKIEALLQNAKNNISGQITTNAVETTIQTTQTIETQPQTKQIPEATSTALKSIDGIFALLKKLVAENSLGIKNSSNTSNNKVAEKPKDSENTTEVSKNQDDALNIDSFNNNLIAFINVIIAPTNQNEDLAKLNNIANNLQKIETSLKEKSSQLSPQELSKIFAQLEKIEDNLDQLNNNLSSINDAKNQVDVSAKISNPQIDNQVIKALSTIENKQPTTQIKDDKKDTTANATQTITTSITQKINNLAENNNKQNQDSSSQNQDEQAINLPEEINNDNKNLSVKFEVIDKDPSINNTPLTQTTQTHHTKTETLTNPISHQVLVKVENYIGNSPKSGDHKIEINLFPENLGKVTVEINSSNNQSGETKVSITAENKNAYEALKNDRASIEKIFENNNLKVDGSNISFDLRSNNQFMQQQARREYFDSLQNGFFGGVKNSISEDLIASTSAIRSYSSSLNLINIFV
ncbi:MAG: flagellar hook-length control protein FliK [Alphaproteobacteria bacterium]|jgi:hypothetical protein